MKNTFKIALAVIACLSLAFTNPRNGDPKQITVVIDAGHGGYDHGAKFEGHFEKDIVAQITKKIIAQNDDINVTIHLTRSEDTFLSLDDRIALINKLQPDLVLSLHVNQTTNAEASGIEFYVSASNTAFEKSKAMAKQLDEKMTQNHDLKSRGVQEAGFKILKKSEFPAITMELGFLSNAYDRKLLTDDEEQHRIAATIVSFISELK